MVLRILRDAVVTLKHQERALSINRTDSLGNIIPPGLLKVANHTAEAIRELRTPTTVTGLRALVRLCYIFTRFVANSARNLSPLSRCLKETKAEHLGHLSEDVLHGLDTLNGILISPPGHSYAKAEWTLHLTHRCMSQTTKICSSTRPGRQRSTSTDQILSTDHHQTGTKPG